MKQDLEGFRLSPAQRRLWLLSEGRFSGYRSASLVRIDGALDAAALARAVDRVVARHEALRTTFHRLPGMILPMQVVAGDSQALWREVDLRSLDGHAERRLLEAFGEEVGLSGDLHTDPPLRASLFRLAEDRHALILGLPALLADAWSLRLLAQEIRDSYAAGDAEGGEAAIGYTQCSEWQNDLLSQPEEPDGPEFWKPYQPAALPPPELPCELPGGGSEEFLPQALPLAPGREIRERLEQVSVQRGIEVPALLLAAWETLLWRLTGRETVVVGEIAAGRDYEVLHGVIGLLGRSLPIPQRFSGALTFAEVAAQIAAFRSDALRWLDYFVWPVNGGPRKAGVDFPLAGFEYADLGADSGPAGPVFTLERQSVCQDRFQVKLACWRRAGRLGAELQFDASRFLAEDMERLASQLRTLLAAALEHPEAPVEHLAFLEEVERRQIVEAFNSTLEDLGPFRAIHELFAEQARRVPEHPALVFEDRRLTYAEVDARANRLAHLLIRLGVGPDIPAALLMDRSEAMIVAMLGALKAGGAYVALDPGQPWQRLGFMLEDCRPAVVLTEPRLVDRLTVQGPRVVVLDRGWSILAAESADDPCVPVQPENLVYLVFTSGSTGRPKGVAVEHRQLLNYVRGVTRRLELPAEGGFATVSTFAADLGHTSIFPALCGGACLHVLSQDCAADPEALAAYFRQHGTDCLKIVPSHMEVMSSGPRPGDVMPRRRLVLGGEALRWGLVEELQRLAPECRIYNHYGPSETTVGVLTYTVSAGRDPRNLTVPLGRPLPNACVYLTDRRLEPVPHWVAGEVYIGGAGVSRGYYGRADLTAERFVPDPFGTEPGARLYRTGDLARQIPSQGIEFLGRADDQVKFHGFRVELGEIRAALNGHPAVRDSVIAVVRDANGRDVLVAYYVARQEQEVGELRRFLEASILEETIPNHFVHLRRLPLTLNGKINFEALPTLEQIRQQPRRRLAPPRTPTEEVLVGIWADVLGLERVGIDDNFFELGGHSLLATQLVSRVRQVFQVDIPLRSLFELPFPSAFAARLDRVLEAGLGVEAPPMVPVPRGGELPPSFAQERLWFMHQLDPRSPAYSIPAGIRLSGRLEIAALCCSLDELVRRHESLRTTFASSEGGVTQVIHPPAPLPLPFLDLAGLPEAAHQGELGRLMEEEARQPFDLAAGPLLRVILVRLGATEHAVLFTMHHIVSDGWSIGILVRELTALYEAFCAGRPSPLRALTLQYADFSSWQRSWLQGGALESQLSHWRRRLAGAPDLDLPTDRPRSDEAGLLGASHRFEIPDEPLRRLREIGRSESSTLFMTLLTAFYALLQGWTGQDDLVVGTDVANRNRLETESLIGFFVNNLVLRANLAGQPTFRELLRQVRNTTLEAYTYQDLPFELLVKELRPRRILGRVPLFQVLFVLQNAPGEPLKLPGLALSPIEHGLTLSKFELSLFLREAGGRLIGTWIYRTALFEQATVARLADRFVQLVEEIAKQPDTPLRTLSINAHREEDRSAMESRERSQAKLRSLRTARRSTVDLEGMDLVDTEPLVPGAGLPLLVRPMSADVDLIEWAAASRDFIEQRLLRHGALLFRGFSVPSVREFERFAQAACPELFGQYGDLPREADGEKVYQSTPYPPDKTILFHNESSHMHRWPLKQLFYCATAAAEGGETPIVDCREMHRRLPADILQRLAGGIVYVRHFVGDLDVSWQEFFKTDDRSVVESFCRQASLDFEWTDKGLRTRQRAPAVARHPKTGETAFFNQLQLHHVACLEPEVRDSLRSVFREEDLPRNVLYADGSPIEDAVMERISELYWELAVGFRWQEGDVLMLDNMLVAHARNPYAGPRKICVAMGELIYLKDLAA